MFGLAFLPIQASLIHSLQPLRPCARPIPFRSHHKASGEEGETKLSRGIPMKRLGEPEEVGHMVVYLASDEAKFVTGSEFRIDGGMTAGRVGK
nr:SDR family oxidoreductase [Aquisalinus flavus]